MSSFLKTTKRSPTGPSPSPTFGNENLVQSGALWANFLPKLYFGPAFGRTRFPQNEPIFAYFRQGTHVGRRRAELRRVTTTTTPDPSLARRSELRPRFPHAVPCALDNICHVWRAGRLAPQLERAALARGWNGIRHFPLVCEQHRIYSSSVRQTVSFRRWCAACGTVAQTRHR
jgi:hypothetical protein